MRLNEMKITPDLFAGIMVAVLSASALLAFAGAMAGNPAMYIAGTALFIAVVPVLVLQSLQARKKVDSSREDR